MNVRTLDLTLARTFITIVEEGSFIRAAELLHLSQPTVSVHMKRLENQLGHELFFKDGRKRDLTEAGNRFVRHARRILYANDVIVAQFHEEPLKGTVTLGATEDFAEMRLPHLLREYAASNPGVKIELVIDVNRKIHDALRQGTVDVAVAAQDYANPRSGEILFKDQLVWIGPDDEELAARRPISLVMIHEPCIVREIVLSRLDESDIPYEIVCSSPSLSGVRTAVQAGLGITARTRAQIETGLCELDAQSGLPILPMMDFVLFSANTKKAKSLAAQRLLRILRTGLLMN